MRERYFKTGRGRDELHRIDSRPVIPAPRLRIAVLLACALLLRSTGASHAQDAAPPTVDLQSRSDEAAVPAATPSNPPDVPELSKLDEAFKQTSMGKDRKSVV